MLDIEDEDGNILTSDQEKLKALVQRNFINDTDHGSESAGEDNGESNTDADIDNCNTSTVDTDDCAKWIAKILAALSKTLNTSAAGPDRIGYRTLKAIKDTWLGKALWQEIATVLKSSNIPKKWRDMTVVFINKPGKDKRKIKAWRPINLINCTGKLAEKIVADELQDLGNLHLLQFGAVKGKSAVDAVVRLTTKA